MARPKLSLQERREIALKALRRIKRNPKSWNQSMWHCGTVCCLAGHVVTIAGGKWRPDKKWGETEQDTETVSVPGYSKGHVSDVARRILGLTEAQTLAGYSGSGGLFCSGNSLEDLRELIDEYLPSQRILNQRAKAAGLFQRK